MTAGLFGCVGETFEETESRTPAPKRNLKNLEDSAGAAGGEGAAGIVGLVLTLFESPPPLLELRRLELSSPSG